MSMSSLSAQLAAIHASGKNSQFVGSTLATSRRHDDAIGRGLSHSAQVGHAVLTDSNGNALRKPSVIYPNSKSAADVPLTILRENAVSSLYQLTKLTGNSTFADPCFIQTLCGLASIQFERGMAMPKDNEAMDLIIRDLLYLLSSAMAQERPSPAATRDNDSLMITSSTTSCFSSCLHVLEYLVRRYDLHSYSMPLIEHWLVSLLPHHEHALFLRVLQLVDLASLPTWIFLRPYAATPTTASALNPPPTRPYLARQVSQHTALVQQIAQLAKRAAQVHTKEVAMNASETEATSSSWPPLATRRGVSHILSFCAAILVEALQWQSTKTGTLDEATIRILLPYLLSACGGSNNGNDGDNQGNKSSKKSKKQLLGASSSKWSLSVTCPEYRGWGHVLASCIVELGVLSAQVQQVLLQTLMQGALELDRACSSVHHHPQDPRRLDAAADSILVLLSVLARLPHADNDLDNDNSNDGHIHQTLLPKVGGYGSKQAFLVMGFPELAYTAIQTLSEWEAFVPAVAYLHSRMDMEVSNLVAAILMVALHRVMDLTTKPKKMKRALSLILELVNAEELVSLWTDPRTCLTSSFASAVVTTFSTWKGHGGEEGEEAGEDSNSVLSSIRSILEGLRQVQPRGVDDGVAHAVFGTQQGKHRKARRKRMALLLGVRSTKQLPSKPVDEHGGQDDMDVDFVLSAGNLLPPRVALEHSDASIRLEAVQRAIQELKNGVSHDDGSLDEALLRRFWVDDHIQVAIAAGEALCDLLQTRHGDRCFSDSFADMSLSCLYRWESFEGNDFKQRAALVGLALTLVAYSISPASTMELSESSWDKVQCCMEAIVSHLEKSLEPDIQNCALTALNLATGAKPVAKQAKVTASETFFSSVIATKGLKQICNSNSLSSFLRDGESVMEIFLRKRYIWVVLQLLVESFTGVEGKELADMTFDCCLLVLRETGTAELTNEQIILLRNCLSECVDVKSTTDVKSVPSILLSIAALGQDVIYESVCVNAIQVACKNVVDSSNKPVPSFVVILEACLRRGSPSLAVERLLSSFQTHESVQEDILVPLLALLAHPEQPVRFCALGVISRLSGPVDEGPVKDFVRAASASKTSITMDGESALPKLLALAIRSSENKAQAAEFILKQCVVSAFSSNGNLSSWIPLQQAAGGNCAAAIVLNAAELAGEQSFPLIMRWTHAGESIFTALLKIKDQSEVPMTLVSLMKTVVRMLKGVVVDEHSASTEVSNVIISSGPNVSGTRTRSYSVGKIDGVTFVKTFPESMGRAIRDCLVISDDRASNKIALHLVRLVIEESVGRMSWGQGIYSKLERSLQQQIASNLLNEVDSDIGDLSASAFRTLPIKTRDLAYFLSQFREGNEILSKVSLIAEVVQSRAPALVHSSHCSELTTALFELLTRLSSDASKFRDTDGLEFARHSILLSLRDLLDQVAKSGDNLHNTLVKENQLVDHAKSLLRLVSDKRHSDSRPLVSQRARSSAVALLAITCSLLPADSVLSMLVSTMSILITDAEDFNQLESLKLARDFLAVVIPVYSQLAVAENLSLGHLFNEFVIATGIVKQQTARIELYGSLVKAVHSTPDFDGEHTPCGGLLALVLSKGERVNSYKDDPQAGFVASIIAQHFSPIAQLSAVQELVHTVDGCLTSLNGRTTKMAKKSQLSVSATDIQILAGWATESDHIHTTIRPEKIVQVLRMACRILASVVEALSSGALRKAIRNRAGSKLCLRLWQDLLLIQSTLNCDLGNQMSSQENRMEWGICAGLADDALRLLQGLLPVEVFLAAVSALMMDDTTEELQARSLRLVADRVTEVDPTSAEASLFLEQVPKFVEVLDKAEGYLVVQAALVATEKMARSLVLESKQNQGPTKEINVFIVALERASAILEKHSMSLTEENFQSEDDSRCQLVSSAALACATFTRVVSIRCLPVLPKLVTSLLKAFSSANHSLQFQASDRLQSRALVSIVQVSVIRAITVLCDVVPQFLGPHLRQLLSPSTLLSQYLYDGGKDRDAGVKAEAELLLSTLAKRIPCRQLVPCATQSIPHCHDVTSICILIKLLKNTTGHSSQSDVASQKNNLQRCLMLAYEFESQQRENLLNVANDLLLAYVLRLSEVQLLSLYARLREWRGELDKSNPESNADRRYAFWRLSGVLTNELKSLFLPCLSTAMIDAIDELATGAMALCIPNISQKGHHGKKKRRVDGDSEVKPKPEYGVKSFQTLVPLLGCLESALKADARDGGKWVRFDDGQRYNSLLEPLGKLLQCQLPPELQVLAVPGRSIFNQLVLGTESEGGSIIDCLTALAAAAGNEQLWKPLNHHILEACGNESRSEVRKAGVSCLLKVMGTIGDEYMVLLPECLPVLSELLEDADEDNVALAQECVAVGEELLGESLQDSLR